MPDPRVRRLRSLFRELGDAELAVFHKGYHKSDLAFHGLETPALRGAVKEVFPPREKLDVDEARHLARELWSRKWMEERAAALIVLNRVAGELRVSDLATLERMTRESDCWVVLDMLATDVLGPMGMARGGPVYAKVRTWSSHAHMWTRRASILIHVRPARAGELAHDFAWDTFEERLFETEFFIRKAVGWALRECVKQYAGEVHAFLLRVGDRASGLTRKEGARNLPERLRRDILGR